ncbi:uncharacterized protein LOC113354520 [Papaver somniferum]|uniref:uncharacterized protein LOC113354520 n=1 Tax=Papaver somniferum TaxID=3469 RepID=UPI000E705CE2|nr:uncharacterized protein LOC113354520 [Papaver somniferum]
MQNIIKEQRNEKKTSILGFCWRDNANIYSQKPLQISDTNKLITRADFVCEVSQAPLETRVVYRVVVQRRVEMEVIVSTGSGIFKENDFPVNKMRYIFLELL